MKGVDLNHHKRIVYVDVDGVLVNPNRHFLDELNRAIGTTYEYKDITAFNYYDCFPREHADILMRMWGSATLYDGWPPEPGAMEAVEEIRTFARVVAISSLTEGHADSKYSWLLGKGFDRKDIFLATDKSLVRGAVLIDDRIENLMGFDGEGICFPQPWNTSWDTANGLRTDNWDEIVTAVRAIIERNATATTEESQS